MGNILKRVFGVVYAEEDAKEIRLRGVRAATVARDLMKVWSTSRIEQNMFNSISNSLISFAPFFAPDVHFVLKSLLHNHRAWSDTKSLSKAIHELETNTWLKNITAEHPDILDRSKLSLFIKTPLEHQENFFNLYNSRVPAYGLNGYILSSGAGTGKTLMGLMLGEMLHADFMIVVCPKNAVLNVWAKALKVEYKKEQKGWVAGGEDPQPYKRQRILICHFEALDKMIEAARQVSGKVVVILDESHNLNEMTAIRTQLFLKLVEQVKPISVVWSSGTPIKALGYEAIPILRTIDPMFTPDVEVRFKKIFGREAKRALNILRNRMGMISFRVEKSSVVNNNPTERVLKVALPNGKDYTLDTIKAQMTAFVTERLEYYKRHMGKYEKLYDDCLDLHEKTLTTPEQHNAFKQYRRFIKGIRKRYDPVEMKAEAEFCNAYELKTLIPSLPQELRKQFKSCRSVIKYVHLKVMGEALGGILGRKRMQCHVDMIPHMKLEEVVKAAKKKTIIFTSYVEVAKQLDAYFQKRGYKPVLIYGGTNSNLKALVDKFESSEEANPAIATFQSLSTAVPMVAASTSVFVNQPFRNHERIQARARIDRLGQDTDVHFVDVLLDTGEEANVSTRSKDILDWSKAQVEAIMGAEYTGSMSKKLDEFYVGVESYAMEEEFVSMEDHYQEEPDSSVTHNGKTYLLNPLFDRAQLLPVKQMSIRELDWVLGNGVPPDMDRVRASDIAVPILVTKTDRLWVVLDGFHRLAKAKMLHHGTIPVRIIPESWLK